MIRLLLLPTLAFVPTGPEERVVVDRAMAAGASARLDLEVAGPDDLRAGVLASKTYGDRIALARE